MIHPFGHMVLVVNPRSGRGGAARTLPELRRHLDEEQIEHTVRTTSGRWHAVELVREAVAEGARYVVAVGGDGTIHEVVNGLLDDDGAPIAPDLVLGVARAGSGADFPRTFGLDRDPRTLVHRHLATDVSMPIDVGQVTCVGPDGSERRRFFANIAEVGYGADVVRRAERLPRWFGRPRYLAAALSTIRSLERSDTELTLGHTRVTVPLVQLVVANAQFFGGGMWVAPRALPDDGLFNVQAYVGGPSQVFTLTPRIYAGDHLPHPDIAEWQSATVDVRPAASLAVEADGEVLGRTPATFRVIPRPLRLSI